MYATATITKDLIYSSKLWPSGIEMRSQVNRVFEVGHYSEFDSSEKIHQFSLKDDDGITYFIGTLKGDENGVAEMENILFDWGAEFAGAALIYVDGELVRA